MIEEYFNYYSNGIRIKIEEGKNYDHKILLRIIWCAEKGLFTKFNQKFFRRPPEEMIFLGSNPFYEIYKEGIKVKVDNWVDFYIALFPDMEDKTRNAVLLYEEESKKLTTGEWKDIRETMPKELQ